MYQGFEKNRNFLKDMKNVFVGIVWQTALVALPIFIVIKKPVPAMISFVISLATSIYLKIFWYAEPSATLMQAVVDLLPQVGVLTAMTVVFLGLARGLARRWQAS